MFGFFIYIATVIYVPHAVMLMGFVILLLQNPKYSLSRVSNFIKKPNYKVSTNLFIIFTIVILSLINMGFNLNRVKDFGDFFPYFIIIPITYFIANVVKPSQWKWLIYFIALECLIGIFQFIIGEPSFFPEFLRFPEAYDPNLLYYRRVYGLSASSSSFANKILVAILLMDYTYKKSTFKNILTLILWFGLFVTFNRTVMIVVVLYYVLKYTQLNLKTYFKPTRFYLNFVVLLIGSILLFAIAWKYSSSIISQFTRNREGLDISGRDQIWAYFLNFIQNNFFFGNGSFKLYNYKGLHAHNSFIQIVATNGFIISIFYIMLIVKNLKFENLVPVIILIVYSLTQYGIFWGISVMDMALFYFLIRASGTKDDFEMEREQTMNWGKLFPLAFSQKSVEVKN